jgi:purine-nucleoside phosphorylase
MDANDLIYKEKVEKAAIYLGDTLQFPPEIVVTLGTGLGAFADDFDAPVVIPYENIPGFPASTVAGHAGVLMNGRISGRSVTVLQGRFHYYEGYSTRELTLPLRALSLLGAETFLVSNAAGGLNPALEDGSLMIIEDHINMIPDNPLRGPNIDEWGVRFPDLSQAYDRELVGLATDSARRLGLGDITTGVYGAIPGPSLETPAETRYLRGCGMDAVGMSTVPEVIVARHSSMRVLGISVIANVNDPDNFKPITLEEVVSCTEKTAEQLSSLLMEVIKGL